ncbi:MAG: hypothetical protein HY735_05815 [Verrucomicrobia bacterium]|nr:hypothetical protein [Verrucomicrobiota bacterium]
MELLRPFIVTSWHGAGEAAMDPEVHRVFTDSPLSKDPHRLNVFAFVLNSRGEVVHGFHGLPGRGGPDRSDWKGELTKVLPKLDLPRVETPLAVEQRSQKLPDLEKSAGSLPAGVRLFIRLDEAKDSFRGRLPVVEVVRMSPSDWAALSFPDEESGKTVEAEALRAWLVHLYPAGIRTADQKVPFRHITGSLKLEPAGSDENSRYALLRGKIHLAKSEPSSAETKSAFEGNLEALLAYRQHGTEVRSLRGVIEGDYLYRVRGTQPMPLRVAIESRPE